MRMLLIAVLSLVVASCSQEVPNIPAKTPVPAAAQVKTDASPVGALPAERIPADAFTLTLGEIDCAETPVAIATVQWDTGSLSTSGVSVYVESPGNARKLWVEAGPKDGAKTGKWVFAGSRFTLQNRATGEVLAQRVVDRIPCQGP